MLFQIKTIILVIRNKKTYVLNIKNVINTQTKWKMDRFWMIGGKWTKLNDIGE